MKCKYKCGKNNDIDNCCKDCDERNECDERCEYFFDKECPCEVKEEKSKDLCNTRENISIGKKERVKVEKTYKTWEIFKMLEEDKTLKFMTIRKDSYRKELSASQNDKYSYFYYKAYGKDNKVIDYSKGSGTFSGNIRLDEVWVLIKKPVTFIEALQSGKKIKVEHEIISRLHSSKRCELEVFSYSDNVISRLAGNLVSRDLTEVILNGKWYVED